MSQEMFATLKPEAFEKMEDEELLSACHRFILHKQST
jgi:hypothetical protein